MEHKNVNTVLKSVMSNSRKSDHSERSNKTQNGIMSL